jgi:hypothetical protein
MSNTAEWQNRQENHRYSQDDRRLAYLFTIKLDPLIMKFLEQSTDKRITVGTYDTTAESWRLLAVAGFRKYGLKVRQTIVNPLTPKMITISLVKSRR